MMVGGGAGAGQGLQHGRKGAERPPYGSTDQGGDQAVTLADAVPPDKPLVTLAVGAAGGAQNTVALHVHHNGVDGAFMAAGVHAHAADDLRAGLVTVLHQDGADGVAGEKVKVHLSGVVN